MVMVMVLTRIIATQIRFTFLCTDQKNDRSEPHGEGRTEPRIRVRVRNYSHGRASTLHALVTWTYSIFRFGISRCVTRYVANNSLKGAAVDFGTDHRRRLSTCYVTRDDEECNSSKRPPAAAGYFLVVFLGI
eukprot:scaffold50794_cov68-Phaeocystis_antarctica.AAC.6